MTPAETAQLLEQFPETPRWVLERGLPLRTAWGIMQRRRKAFPLTQPDRRTKQMTTKTEKPKTEKPAKAKKAVEPVSITKIAAELNLDPKIARAKLRRATDDDNLPNPISDTLWAWKPADVAKVKAFLKTDKRRAE